MHSCKLSIPYSTNLVEQFLKYWGPTTTNREDHFQELRDDNMLMQIFVTSMEFRQKKWLMHSCKLRITYPTNIFEQILKYWGPTTMNREDHFQKLRDGL